MRRLRACYRLLDHILVRLQLFLTRRYTRNCGGNGDSRLIQTGLRVSPPLLSGNLAQGRPSSFLPSCGRFLFKITSANGKAGTASGAHRSGTVMNRGTTTADYIM